MSDEHDPNSPEGRAAAGLPPLPTRALPAAPAPAPAPEPAPEPAGEPDPVPEPQTGPVYRGDD